MERVRISFKVDPEVMSEVRDCVAFLLGPPYNMTIQDFVESALVNELRRLAGEANNGRAFPGRAQATLRGNQGHR